jgi:hypothetical protein
VVHLKPEKNYLLFLRVALPHLEPVVIPAVEECQPDTGSVSTITGDNT